jgi:hypothetical protein
VPVVAVFAAPDPQGAREFLQVVLHRESDGAMHLMGDGGGLSRGDVAAEFCRGDFKYRLAAIRCVRRRRCRRA